MANLGARVSKPAGGTERASGAGEKGGGPARGAAESRGGAPLGFSYSFATVPPAAATPRPGLPPAGWPTAPPPGPGSRAAPALSVPSDAAEREADAVAARVAAEPAAPPPADAYGGGGGGGQPLRPADRRFFEQRLGHDLSRVRVHADRPAAEAARAFGADAFTVGRDVAFAEGRYDPGSAGGRRLLAHELVHVIQRAQTTPLPGGAAISVAWRPSAATIARQASADGPDGPAAAPPEAAASAPAPAPASASASSGAPAVAGLVVDDDAAALTGGQMRKTEFLSALRSDACAAADRELARAGRDTRGCPYVERWLAHYGGRPAAHVERAVRKLAPGAAAVRSARDYIPLVSARISQGVAAWVSTGQLPGDLPDELRAELPSGGIAAAIGGAASSLVGAIGGALSAVGRLFFKEAPGGARAGADRGALAARLGPGRPLDGPARGRMERVFGESFAEVRLHDDDRAAGLARDLNAHAFTLGTHVAFSSGSFRPGTPVGDGLLAHELAHVVQQRGAPADVPARLAAGADGGLPRASAAMEAEADGAAADAVGALYAAPAAGAKRRGPRVRRASGLSLARCNKQQPLEPKQTLPIYVGDLPGNRRNVDGDVSKANSIYNDDNPLNVTVQVAGRTHIENTTGILDANQELRAHPDDPGAASSAEEVALQGRIGGDVRVFYVKDFVSPASNLDVLGGKPAGTLGHPAEVAYTKRYEDSHGTIVGGRAGEEVLAHELGHVMLGPKKSDHNVTGDNLMSEIYMSGATKLTPAQMAEMKKSDRLK
jgi:hypothetical protein